MSESPQIGERLAWVAREQVEAVAPGLGQRLLVREHVVLLVGLGQAQGPDDAERGPAVAACVIR